MNGTLAELEPETIKRVKIRSCLLLEPRQSIDIIGDATPERYAKSLEVAAKDSGNDGMLVILTPQANDGPHGESPPSIEGRMPRIGKPGAWPAGGAARKWEGRNRHSLDQGQRNTDISVSRTPAARTCSQHMRSFTENCGGEGACSETSKHSRKQERPSIPARQTAILDETAAGAKNRTILDRVSNPRKSSAHTGVPVTHPEYRPESADDAVTPPADSIGYPVGAETLNSISGDSHA
jgi:acetyltransferase